MALRPTLFTRWLTQPTRASQIFRATIQRASPGPAQRPFSLQSTIQKNNLNKSPFRRTLNNSTSRARTNQKQQQQQRYNSNSTNPNARANQSHTQQPPKEPTGLSARLKKLTREYGWAALGVYLTLSALDFPFCFAAVRLLGVERIGHFEHVILGYLKGLAGPLWPGSGSKQSADTDSDETTTSSSETDTSAAKVDGEVVGADGAVIAEKNGEASTYTISSRFADQVALYVDCGYGYGYGLAIILRLPVHD